MRQIVENDLPPPKASEARFRVLAAVFLPDVEALRPLALPALANALLESGQVTGNIVLLAPEPLS
jgi:hypothetical protein